MPSPSHISFLDQLRGFAILTVFLHHSTGASYGVAALEWQGFVPASFDPVLALGLGWSGVAIFFVVSGFCIHLSHARSGESDFRAFFIRRFFRIYPTYLLALGIFSFVYPFQNVNTHSLFGWAQFAAHALMLHNADPRFFYGINASLWSLAIECQLYLLYPLLVWLAGRRGWKTALLLAAAVELALRGMAALHGFSEETPQTHVFRSPLAFWYSWAIGAAIADAFLKQEKLPFSTHPVSVWLLLAVASNFIRPLNDFSFPLFAVTTAVILAKFLGGKLRLPRVPMLGSHLRFAGIASYSLYLIHQPLIGLVPKCLLQWFPAVALSSVQILTLCLLTWPLMLGLAWMMYRTIEIHSIGLGKSVTGYVKLRYGLA